MDPFERELRDLPWRSAPETLRQRLFAAPPSNVVHKSFRSCGLLGWAAVVLFLSSLFGYLLFHRPPISADRPVLLVQADLTGIGETGTHRNFFDLSDRMEDAWSGSLTLTIDSSK